MKRTILFLSLLFAGASFLHAQNQYTALRFSQQFYDGTARSIGMGNALTSLGGDQGAITYNPAAAGVYRYSEISVTPSIYTNVSRTSYLGNLEKQSRTRFSLANLGWVGGFNTGRKHGLLNMNFSITTNQNNNFNFRTSASGLEAQTSYFASIAANMPEDVTGDMITMKEADPELPFKTVNTSWTSILAWNTGLIDTLAFNNYYWGATENLIDGRPKVAGDLNQKFFNERTGYTQDIVLNAAGNVNEIFFFGLNVTFQNIWYNEFSSFTESAADPTLFGSGFVFGKSSSNVSTSGFGINVKAGIIVRPVAGLSLGTSISTPTWLYLSDSWNENMIGKTGFGEYELTSPSGSFSYRVVSPLKWNLGIGYTFGGSVALALDYELVDYGLIRMKDGLSRLHDDTFDAENSYIRDNFKTANNLRAGLEYRVVPQFSLRLGYNYYDSPEKNVNTSRHYASAGLGYRGNSGFFVDLAYQQQCNHNRDDYSLYDPYYDVVEDAMLGVPVLSERYLNWKLYLTLGFRF